LIQRLTENLEDDSAENDVDTEVQEINQNWSENTDKQRCINILKVINANPGIVYDNLSMKQCKKKLQKHFVNIRDFSDTPKSNRFLSTDLRFKSSRELARYSTANDKVVSKKQAEDLGLKLLRRSLY